MFICAVKLTPAVFLFAVLVALYEETDKPNNALEYPLIMHEAV